MKFLTIVLACALWLSACKQQPAPTQLEIPEDAAARIGTTILTEGDIQHTLALLNAEDKKFAQTPLGRQNLVQILTREKLILQDARQAGLDSQKDYLQLLAQQRAALDRAYQDFADNTLIRLWYEQKEKELAPSEKEIKDYFAKYPYEMTIKQIILDNAQTADQVLRTLKSSPGRWKEMSHQYNIAPENLRTLTFMPGEYLANLEVVAANSPTGRPQGFFKTPQGFHIIMKTGETRLSFDKAAPRITQILQQQKLDQLLDTLKTKYEVIIYDKNE